MFPKPIKYDCNLKTISVRELSAGSVSPPCLGPLAGSTLKCNRVLVEKDLVRVLETERFGWSLVRSVHHELKVGVVDGTQETRATFEQTQQRGSIPTGIIA